MGAQYSLIYGAMATLQRAGVVRITFMGESAGKAGAEPMRAPRQPVAILQALGLHLLLLVPFVGLLFQRTPQPRPWPAARSKRC